MWMKKANSFYNRAGRRFRPCRVQDYKYRRAGTRNIFLAVEPKGGHRQAEVTASRAKPDFVQFVGRLVEKAYAGAQKIHLVMDNLNTHFRSSFVEVLGVKRAEQMLARVKLHYTLKHASWLNMAEIEIGVMDRQCIGGRLASEAMLRSEVAAWKHRRNQAQTRIE